MRKFSSKFVFLTVIFVGFVLSIYADQPPDPGGGPIGGEPVGGGSPIGGSLLILFFLLSGYTARRIYEIRKNT